jgi:N-acetylglucosaminyldiphosphoundecaprenol N-acetyl-beta-D-mannosaminyltransferase
VSLFGAELHAVGLNGAVTEVLGWVERGGRDCRYVVTMNVDHAVLLRRHEGLRRAYGDARLVLADGMPVVLASRFLGRPLPGRVTGSDLVPALFEAAPQGRPLSVYLLGAGPGVPERAARKIESAWPQVRVVGSSSPPFGFESDPAENDAILNGIGAARPDLLVLGFGAPKQEVWLHTHRDRVRAHAAVCAGATIDFLAGEKVRAPLWMRRWGLEWLFRLASEPRRLAGRYALDAWIFPRLVWDEWRKGRR